MVKPIDPHARVRHIFPEDEQLPPEERTGWFLRAVTKRERAYCQDAGATALSVEADDTAGDLSKRAAKIDVRTGTVRLARVRFALANVDNYGVKYESAPNPLGVGPDVPSDNFLDTIPEEVFDWLSDLAEKSGRVTVAEGKKSSPESTDSSTKDSPPSAGSASDEKGKPTGKRGAAKGPRSTADTGT